MEKVKLGKIFEYLPKSKFKAGDGKERGKYKFFTSSNVQNKFIDEFIYDGEYLIFGTGGKASINYCNDKFSTSTDNFVVKVNKEINTKLIFLYFQNNMDKLEKGFKGASIKHISKKYINQLMIPKYNYQQQLKIVNELDKVQEIINIRKKQIKQLDELIKSQFVEMFENKNFEKTIIGNCAKFQCGYAFKSKDFVDDGIRLVQISNVNKDTLDWIEVNKVPKDFIGKYKEYLLNEDDVVMAMTRPIIKSLNEVKIAKVTKNDLPCLLNQRVGRFILEDKINKEFLIYCCKSDKFKNYVEKMSGNSLQPNISSKQIENYEIIIPPIELQNKFAEFVKQVDKQKFEIQKILEEIQKLQESLMHKYFN